MDDKNTEPIYRLQHDEEEPNENEALLRADIPRAEE